MVLEDYSGRTFQVPRAWLPTTMREGDVVRIQIEPVSVDGSVVIRVEPAPDARAEQLRAAEQTRSKIPRGPKGDISL